MPIPPKKPGEKRFSVSYDKPPAALAHTYLFARDPKHAKEVFKTYVGKYKIINIIEK